MLLAVIMISPCVMGAELEYYGIEDTIKDDLTVHNNVVLKFKQPIGHLDYNAGFRVYNLTTEANFPFADCRASNSDSGSLIACDFTGMTTENNKLTLKFNTKDAITKKNGNYRFGVSYGVDVPMERAFIVIKLPENGILSEQVANQSFYPTDGYLASDGRRIMVYWERENITTTDDLIFSVLYSMPGSRDDIFNYIIVFLTLLILGVMVAIAVYMKRGVRGTSTQKVVEAVLNKDERTIISIVKRNGGKVGQKVIVKESDFSKAKVSRIVKSLKGRGILATEPISGRENRVILKEVKTGEEGE